MTSPPDPPLVVHFETSDSPAIDRILGRVTDEVMAGCASSVVFVIAPAALDSQTGERVHDWHRRNAELLRSHVRAIAFVAPSLWGWLVLRAAFLGEPPPVPYTVSRSLERAMASAMK